MTMTDKRFMIISDELNNIESIIDLITKQEYDYLDIESLLNKLSDEIKILRRDGTKLKLVLLQIIEDLEDAEDNEEYINWIKENCNLKLYSESDIDELHYINRKRTVEYIHNKQKFQELLDNANHSIEYETILRISKIFGIDWNDC